ncbi:hypothetical protein Pan97_47880 [Bremerella volcania]|uniref:Uncharacterized protein n=1 Tax=Bremerella volcania TaxID=2527984 RepID=A0A518CEW7_9BACT|nr:hypothetical protein [Bremerella volcania]QDU77714.1 hypothetical protein Pan97_47880 [Bremerella volcania]
MSSPSQSHPSSANFFCSNRFTTVLLGLFLIELIGISVDTYLDIRKRIQPRNLAEQAEQEIRKNYPKLRRELTTEIKTQAPNIAEAMSEQLIGSSPQIRQWLQETTRRQLRLGLHETTKLSSAQFQSFVRDNHAEIEELFVQLEETPEHTEEIVLDLESNIENSWGVQLQNQTENALSLHRKFNDKLEKINRGTSLTPKELLERRIVRIVRTLADERLPELPSSVLPQEIPSFEDNN